MKHNPAFFPREVTIPAGDTQEFYSVVAIDVISGMASDSVMRIGASDIAMPFPGRALEAITPVPELEVRAGAADITLRVWTGDGSAMRIPTVRDIAAPVVMYTPAGASVGFSGNVPIIQVRTSGGGVIDFDDLNTIDAAPGGVAFHTIVNGRDSTGQGRPLRVRLDGALAPPGWELLTNGTITSLAAGAVTTRTLVDGFSQLMCELKSADGTLAVGAALSLTGLDDNSYLFGLATDAEFVAAINGHYLWMIGPGIDTAGTGTETLMGHTAVPPWGYLHSILEQSTGNGDVVLRIFGR